MINDQSNSKFDAATVSPAGTCAAITSKAGVAVERWLQAIDCPAKHLIDPIEVYRTDPRQKRQLEFRAGRNLAATLLSRYGQHGSVGVNEDRSPDWPDGYVGSISHSGRWIWAAVARASEVGSIGIDTEPVVDVATSEQIASEIATITEWELAKSLPLDAQQVFSVVFSAKEAFFKCWYPRTRRYFGFEHATVDGVAHDRIRIRNLASNPNSGFEPKSLDVFYLCNGSDVFTATWMPQEKP